MVGKALSMAASIDIIVTPGFKELTGRLSSLEDLAQILAPVDRRQLVRHSVRVLNSLAVSRQTGLADSQEAFLEALPVDLRRRRCARRRRSTCSGRCPSPTPTDL